MNRNILIAITFLLLSSSAQAQAPERRPSASPTWESTLAEVRQLDVADYEVGFTLSPGKFHRLSDKLLQIGKAEDFQRLLTDQSPIVRVMGLICLARIMSASDFQREVGWVRGDGEQVRYRQGCIVGQSASVEEIAQQLAAGKFFIGESRVR